MSRYAEKQLIAHLLDEDSIEFLIKNGVPAHIIPTDELRDVFIFASEYYLSGKLAPTEEVFDNHEVSVGRSIGNLLDDLELDWRGGAETSLDWVIKELTGSYITANSHTLFREGAQALAESDTDSRLEVLTDFTSKAVQLVSLLQDRRTKVDAREVMQYRLDAYEQRVNNVDVAGLSMGLPEIDDYTNMVQPGELAMLAAFAKVGKTYMLDLIALKEWQRGRIPAIFTLEISIDMTLDRIACLACGVDSTRWQRGECDDSEIERVRTFIKEMQNDNHPFLIFSPEIGNRTPESMVRLAQVSEADSMIIDQLSHIEFKSGQGHRPSQFAEIMQSLSTIITTGPRPIPTLLAHQITREGKKAADKCGYYEMEHLAETSAAERYCSFVFSMYQSKDMFQIHHVLLQVLAARRAPIKWWDMVWRPEIGVANIKNELQPYAE